MYILVSGDIELNSLFLILIKDFIYLFFTNTNLNQNNSAPEVVIYLETISIGSSNSVSMKKRNESVTGRQQLCCVRRNASETFYIQSPPLTFNVIINIQSHTLILGISTFSNSIIVICSRRDLKLFKKT